MNDSEPPQWNLLFDKFFEGDEMPLYKQLEFIVIRHHFFRGKRLFEIKRQYDTEPEDYFQEIFIEIITLDYLRRWKREKLSDSEMNHKIRGLIRNRLIDKARRKHLIITDEIEILVSSEIIEEKESEILDSVKERLTERQRFIFENYHKFRLGDCDVQMLADELSVSKKTVEPEIKKIKEIIKEEFVKHSPQLKKYLKDK